MYLDISFFGTMMVALQKLNNSDILDIMNKIATLAIAH